MLQTFCFRIGGATGVYWAEASGAAKILNAQDRPISKDYQPKMSIVLQLRKYPTAISTSKSLAKNMTPRKKKKGRKKERKEEKKSKPRSPSL